MIKNRKHQPILRYFLTGFCYCVLSPKIGEIKYCDLSFNGCYNIILALEANKNDK